MSRPNPVVRLETLALIAVGGVAGANARLLAAGILPEIAAITLANALGSFLLGALVYGAEATGLVGRRARLVFATGFCSSLSTYSGFAAGTALAVGDPLALGSIVVANYGLGFAGVLLGRAAVRRLGGALA